MPVLRLSEVFRQADASRTVVNARRINQGAMPDLNAPAGDSDFYFVPAEDPETAVQRILELVRTRIPKRFGLNPTRDIQVLCPMNRGGVGARSLNIELQAALNPARRTQGRAFRPEAGELVASFDGGRRPTASASSTRWFPPTPPPSTRARV